VPDLRDSPILDKVDHFRGSENPDIFSSPMPSDLKWSPRTSFGVVKRYQKGTTFITFTQSQSIENKNLFGSLKTKAKSLVKSQNYLMQ
jgi:hypothetical protein